MKKIKIEASCAICKKTYETNHALTLTCSPECGEKLRQQRRRERYARSKEPRITLNEDHRHE
jgi:predicted nucleic acid-binding Zn ribbon protein